MSIMVIHKIPNACTCTLSAVMYMYCICAFPGVVPSGADDPQAELAQTNGERR